MDLHRRPKLNPSRVTGLAPSLIEIGYNNDADKRDQPLVFQELFAAMHQARPHASTHACMTRMSGALQCQCHIKYRRHSGIT
jgi:hypothetical protein